MLEREFEPYDPALRQASEQPVAPSSFFLSRSMKRVDWNLHVFAAPFLEEEEMMASIQMAPMQRLGTHSETDTGVAKETDPREIAKQGQATRS